MPIGAQSTSEAYHRLKLRGIECMLVSVLLQLTCWGLVPWSVAQRIAQAACEDNVRSNVTSHPDLLNMSRIGTEGAHSGNVRRDAMVQYKPRPELEGILQPVIVPCMKTKAIDRIEPAWVWLPIILPNLLFDTLYHSYPKKFKGCLGDGLEAFWSKVTCETRVQTYYGTFLAQRVPDATRDLF